MKPPAVSVIIPIKELSYYLLFENLPALDKQTWKNFEVIVLPNQLSQYDFTLLKKYRWLRIIPTGKITRPAKKRDIGVKYAKGKIIAFIDDDAYPTDDWLEKAVEVLKHRQPAAICGPGILPPEAGFWETVFDEVLKTWVGSGGLSFRFIKQKKRYVDDYPSMNFLIRKHIFKKLGGFNSNYWPGEDSKLCEDLVYKQGKTILYTPAVSIYHHRRKNLKDFLKQHANYGFHRGAFFSHGDRNSRRFSYLIPTIFVLYLLLFPFYFLLSAPIFYFPLVIYFFLMLYVFLRSLINTRNLLISFTSPLVLFLTHLTYGIMFVKGVVKGLKTKTNIYQ